MDFKIFVHGIKKLSMAFPKSTPDDLGKDEVLITWQENLNDISNENFLTAIKRIIVTEKYFPCIATIREYALNTMDTNLVECDEAYGKVLNAIHCYGANRKEEALNSLPPLIKRAVLATGTFEEFCMCSMENTNVLRAQFAKAYKSILNREKTKITDFKELEHMGLAIENEKILGIDLSSDMAELHNNADRMESINQSIKRIRTELMKIKENKNTDKENGKC